MLKNIAMLSVTKTLMVGYLLVLADLKLMIGLWYIFIQQLNK